MKLGRFYSPYEDWPIAFLHAELPTDSIVHSGERIALYFRAENIPPPMQWPFFVQLANGQTLKRIMLVMVEQSSVAETAVKGHLQIYPNPATSSLHVNAAPNATVTLLDLLGRTVRTSTLDARGSGQFAVDKIVSGSYILRVADDDRVQSRMIGIKN